MLYYIILVNVRIKISDLEIVQNLKYLFYVLTLGLYKHHIYFNIYTIYYRYKYPTQSYQLLSKIKKKRKKKGMDIKY